MIFVYLWQSDHFARFSVFASAEIVGAIFFVNIFINVLRIQYYLLYLHTLNNETR